MSKVNWERLAIGGLIAAVICFMTDGFMHEVLLKADWQATFEAIHASPPKHNPLAFGYFGLLELGRGFVALFVYAMMRARSGPGPKTAIMAAIVSWVSFSFTGPAQYVPLGLLSCGLWLKAAAFQLVTSILATLAGASLYKERK